MTQNFYHKFLNVFSHKLGKLQEYELDFISKKILQVNIHNSQRQQLVYILALEVFNTLIYMASEEKFWKTV